MTLMYQNKEWLQKQINEGLTNEEIAQISGCSSSNVSRYITKFKLTRQDSAELKYRSKKWLQEALKTKTDKEIAALFGVNP